MVKEDLHGMNLPNAADALSYAERTIDELRREVGYDNPQLIMIVQDYDQHTIWSLPFLPAVRTICHTHTISKNFCSKNFCWRLKIAKPPASWTTGGLALSPYAPVLRQQRTGCRDSVCEEDGYLHLSSPCCGYQIGDGLVPPKILARPRPVGM
jgi:hypothetical protein